MCIRDSAHTGPVGGLIDRPPETTGINKGLQKQYRMTEPLLPVMREPLFAQRQNTGTQIRDMPVRKNEEAAIVHHQLQSIILMAEAPADPAIPCTALPR